MVSCHELLKELSNYIDDDVPPDVRRAIEAHLGECRTCRVLYDSTLKTIRIVTDVRAFELPSGASQRLLARLRKELGPDFRPPDDDTAN